MNVPAGASGSSMIRTKLLVPGGTFSHDTAGDSLAPVQVYASGNTAPGTSASTRTEKLPFSVAGRFITGVAAAADGDWGAESGCGVVQPHSQRADARQSRMRKKARCFMIGIGDVQNISLTETGLLFKKRREPVSFWFKFDLNATYFSGKEIVEQGHYRSHDEGNNPKNDREKNN